MHPNMTSKEAEGPPEQVEPVDLSVRATKMADKALHAPFKSYKEPPGVVLKVPTFPALSLHPLGVDLSIKAESDSPPSPDRFGLSLEAALRPGSTTLLSIQKIREASLNRRGLDKQNGAKESEIEEVRDLVHA